VRVRVGVRARVRVGVRIGVRVRAATPALGGEQLRLELADALLLRR